MERGDVFGVRAQKVFRRIFDFITQSTEQSGSVITHRLLVTLARITFTNAQKWALAHNRPRDPDNVVTDLADYYYYDERKLNRMIHSSGPKCMNMVDPHNGGDNIDKRPLIRMLRFETNNLQSNIFDVKTTNSRLHRCFQTR